MSAAHFTLSELETGPIEREELSDGGVAYRNVKVLESGTWTDSGSRETIWYSPRGLDNLEVRDENTINIMHDADNDVSAVGKMENPRAQDGELYADLVIDTSTAAGKYADENLQTTLESGGAKGFGGPSVEIDAEGQEIEYNSDRGLKELVKGYISGLGLVKNPASKPVSFARQTANRGVALSEGQSHYTLEGKPPGMSEIDAENVLSALGLEDSEIELQDGVAIQDLIGLVAQERDIPVDELMQAIDGLEGGDVENAEDEEEEEEEEEEKEAEENEEDDEDEDRDMDDVPDEFLEEHSNMKQRIQALEDELSTLRESVLTEEETESLADAETAEELSDAVEEIDKRLSEVEEQPEKPRSMADSGESASVFDGGRRLPSTDSTGTTTR